MVPQAGGAPSEGVGRGAGARHTVTRGCAAGVQGGKECESCRRAIFFGKSAWRRGLRRKREGPGKDIVCCAAGVYHLRRHGGTLRSDIRGLPHAVRNSEGSIGVQEKDSIG